MTTNNSNGYYTQEEWAKRKAELDEIERRQNEALKGMNAQHDAAKENLVNTKKIAQPAIEEEKKKAERIEANPNIPPKAKQEKIKQCNEIVNQHEASIQTAQKEVTRQGDVKKEHFHKQNAKRYSGYTKDQLLAAKDGIENVYAEYKKAFPEELAKNPHHEDHREMHELVKAAGLEEKLGLDLSHIELPPGDKWYSPHAQNKSQKKESLLENPHAETIPVHINAQPNLKPPEENKDPVRSSNTTNTPAPESHAKSIGTNQELLKVRQDPNQSVNQQPSQSPSDPKSPDTNTPNINPGAQKKGLNNSTPKPEEAKINVFANSSSNHIEAARGGVRDYRPDAIRHANASRRTLSPSGTPVVASEPTNKTPPLTPTQPMSMKERMLKQGANAQRGGV